jgi:hypothetical protein
MVTLVTTLIVMLTNVVMVRTVTLDAKFTFVTMIIIFINVIGLRKKLRQN